MIYVSYATFENPLEKKVSEINASKKCVLDFYVEKYLEHGKFVEEARIEKDNGHSNYYTVVYNKSKKGYKIVRTM